MCDTSCSSGCQPAYCVSIPSQASCCVSSPCQPACSVSIPSQVSCCLPASCRPAMFIPVRFQVACGVPVGCRPAVCLVPSCQNSGCCQPSRPTLVYRPVTCSSSPCC
uniref:Keratin-associated protein 12-1-like n=1 Tax=Castor canadensis TaxID=51338 RepID=A0A8B7VLG4_CASCN|nr:keratin-associated protein 12-1-like [Castor canadensis]